MATKKNFEVTEHYVFHVSVTSMSNITADWKLYRVIKRFSKGFIVVKQ